MAEKKGPSTIGGGDAGGAFGDGDHTHPLHRGLAHGIGPKLASMHETALAKASPARAALHADRMHAGRSESLKGKTMAQMQQRTGAHHTRNVAAMHLATGVAGSHKTVTKNKGTVGATKQKQFVATKAKASKTGTSNWAAWNAAHKK